jgi:hypothetical protein
MERVKKEQADAKFAQMSEAAAGQLKENANVKQSNYDARHGF